MNKEEVMERLWKKARFAKNSHDENLVYEVIGEFKMANFLGAVTYNDLRELETFLIRDGLNNPKWIKEVD